MSKTKKKTYSREFLKEFSCDIRNLGPQLTKRKHGLSTNDMQELMFEGRMANLEEDMSLQREIHNLKRQGYTSVEASQKLNIPLSQVNDLWSVFFKKKIN